MGNHLCSCHSQDHDDTSEMTKSSGDGRFALSGESSAVVCEAMMNREPVPVLRLNRDVPPRLEDIITKAMEKDRELRYQNAADMRTDLQRVKRDSSSGRTNLAGPVLETGSGLAPKTPESSSAVTTSRKIYIYAVFALLLLLAAGVFSFYRSRSAPALNKDWEQITFFTDSAVYPAFSPDGRMLTIYPGE